MSSVYRGGCEVLDYTQEEHCSLGRFQCEIETEPESSVLNDSSAALIGVNAITMQRMTRPHVKLVIRLDNELEAGFYVPAVVPEGESLPIVLKYAPAWPDKGSR